MPWQPSKSTTVAVAAVVTKPCLCRAKGCDAIVRGNTGYSARSRQDLGGHIFRNITHRVFIYASDMMRRDMGGQVLNFHVAIIGCACGLEDQQRNHQIAETQGSHGTKQLSMSH